MLKGRQHFATDLSRTMGLTVIMAEVHSQEYNAYFGTLRQRL